ncbi:MAG: hypothetical protein LBB55_02935 [Zoogloeaceae bacterium]|jgi:hypothetical protein|nr:hypothetical protein [Zoogloeaceae bacterium]
MNGVYEHGESYAMSQQLRLAAIVALLSSSALRGATACKSAALCMHLETLLEQSGTIEPQLREIVETTLDEWKLASRTLSCPGQCCASAQTVLH